MSNVTSMSRCKTLLNELKKALGSDYKSFDLHGKDEQSCRFNDKGYTKAINSDYMRVFQTSKQANMKEAKSFALAFNNYHKSNSGVIVSVKDGKKQEIAYFTFDQFKPKLKEAVEKLQASSDKSAATVNSIINSVFETSPELCNLDIFFSHLTIKLREVEKTYSELSKKIANLKDQVDVARKTLNKTDLKSKKNELQDEIGKLYAQFTPITDSYIEILNYETSVLIEQMPYLSRRLIGLILQPHVAKHNAPRLLQGVLQTELKASPSRSTYMNNEYND